MKRLFLTIALGSAAYGVYKLYKAMTPCYAAAKQWDNEFSQLSAVNSSRVRFSLHTYYLDTSDETFELLTESRLLDDNPEWLIDGLDEIKIENNNISHIGEQAKFAAKFSVVQWKLDNKTAREVKVLGAAYFNHNRNFSMHQRLLIRDAMVERLQGK